MPNWIVTIRERRRQEQRRLQTLAAPSKRGDVLSRRVNTIINFWDLGRLADGTDWMTTYLPTLTYPAGYTVSSEAYTGTFDTSTFDPTDIFAAQLAVEPDVNNWSEAFHKIEYEEAERYGLEIMPPSDTGEYDSDPTTWLSVARAGTRDRVFAPGVPVTEDFWTPDGLKVPASPRLALLTGGAFYRLNTSSTTRQKVTALPDPTAAAVPFALRGRCDVYLTPCLQFWYMIGVKQTTVAGHIWATKDILDGVIRPWDRATFLTNAPLEASLGTFPLCWTTTATPDNATGEIFEDYMQTLPSAKLQVNIADDTAGTAISQTMEDPATFPVSAATNPVGGVTNTVPYENLLMALVKQGNNTYYLWGKGTDYGYGKPTTISYLNT